MDPKLTSIVTSGVLWLGGILAGWMVQHGLISADDQLKVVNAMVTLGSVAGAGALMWWKARQHSQMAAIAQVNSDNNGLKVVSETSSSTRVNAPIIGPEAPK